MSPLLRLHPPLCAYTCPFCVDQSSISSLVSLMRRHVPKYMLPRGMQVAEMNKRKKRRRARSSNRSASRRTDNDPLQSYEGGDVTLDGVAGDADDGVVGGDTNTGTSEQDAKKAKVFVDSADGTGRSSSGRNQWKQRHGRGKFSRRFAKKHGVNGGSTKAGW